MRQATLFNHKEISLSLSSNGMDTLFIRARDIKNPHNYLNCIFSISLLKGLYLYKNVAPLLGFPLDNEGRVHILEKVPVDFNSKNFCEVIVDKSYLRTISFNLKNKFFPYNNTFTLEEWERGVLLKCSSFDLQISNYITYINGDGIFNFAYISQVMGLPLELPFDKICLP